ncbi:GatB/YqeY domain-containing protein [bacterium]|nr:GatB/YqeY domain-containing protein [bacterium]
MGLEERINQDIKEAMKAREQGVLEALRAIKSAVLLAKTEKGASEVLDADAELKLLQRLQKQRKEAADIYATQNRPDLESVERFQAEVIGRYLPEPLSAEAVEQALKQLIGTLGLSGSADLGKLMGASSKALAGQVDGKTLSETARRLLS